MPTGQEYLGILANIAPIILLIAVFYFSDDPPAAQAR